MQSSCQEHHFQPHKGALIQLGLRSLGGELQNSAIVIGVEFPPYFGGTDETDCDICWDHASLIRLRTCPLAVAGECTLLDFRIKSRCPTIGPEFYTLTQHASAFRLLAAGVEKTG